MSLFPIIIVYFKFSNYTITADHVIQLVTWDLFKRFGLIAKVGGVESSNTRLKTKFSPIDLIEIANSN